MKRTRQPLPAGLADMPPGPALAAVLAGVDPRRLSALDCLELMQARHRQAGHDQAQLMAAMVEVALCGIGPDDQLPRMAAPDEFSADEIRAALAWTRRAADSQLSLAWDLIHRLPQVFAALDAGAIDVPKTKVFSEWTDGLTDTQAHQICDQLLPGAPRLTTGQLTERIKRMAIAVDPGWARRRYEEAVRDRKVVGYRNEDGSANLSGYNLPAERTAAACNHIDALAKKVKRSGDTRPIDHIRADLYLGMLDGSYTALSDTDIIGLLATAEPPSKVADHPVSQPDDARAPRCRDASASPLRREGTQQRTEYTAPNPGTSGTGGQASNRPCLSDQRRDTPPSRQRRAGVEIRAEITTLLGLNDHPAEIAGWGPVHADVARSLVHDQTAAEWRYAITDDRGRLLCEGITRHRPAGYLSRDASPTRGGIVEIQIQLTTLKGLATRPARLHGWAKVIADLLRQAGQHHNTQHDNTQHNAGHDDQHDAAPDAQKPPAGRSPGTPLRRRTQIRDRTCVHPTCRTPAYGTDGDHTHDWAHGGNTRDDNIGSLCRHDHRLKHQGGWTLTQPEPGIFVWTSRLGAHYHVRPPLIIQPLPRPIHREPPPCDVPARGADPGGNEYAPIWCAPATAPRKPDPQHEPDPRPPPQAEDPPF